jgi:hypothetical protein
MLVGPGPGNVPVFTILMQANTPTPAGVPVKPVSLVGDPADDASLAVEIMPNNPDGFVSIADLDTHPIALTDEQVYLGSTAVTVLPPLAGGEGEFINLKNPLDVNADDSVSASDALTVINTLNTLGAQSLKSLPANQIQWMVDTNMDSSLSAIDALTVINYINSHPSLPAHLLGGEGEAVPATAGAEGEGGTTADNDLALLSGVSGLVTSTQSTTQSSSQSLLVQMSSSASDSSAGSVTLTTSKQDDDSPLSVDASAADELFTDLFLATNDSDNGSNLG